MVVTNDPTIKGYELIEQIGKGAYGSVFRAYQPHMRREVAVKIIKPRYANQPDFIRRFDVEAQLIAQLEHLHIVPLYDYWREPDGAYLVMRLMKGGSLEDTLKANGPFASEQAATLVDHIASALDTAHQQGIVHRDLKPANILLDDHGNAYLSDFGIAKELSRGSAITQTGAIVGTPAYMTPEQVQSRPVTPQTDIYSLGVVIYELLVGGHPFLDTPTAELVVKHLNEPLPLVSDQRPDLPEDIDTVIQLATAKDPLSRYPDALALAADFRKALHLESEESVVPESEIYNPYKGLRPFQESDAGDFFGRDNLIKQMLARLGEQVETSRFLAIVGPSGSGKSSVVKAGLVPVLRAGELHGSENWFITEMKPGVHPLEELELAVLRVATVQPPSLLGQIKEDDRGLLRAVRRILPEGGELLLFVDQFEELYTLVHDIEKVNFFLRSICEAVSDPKSPLRVVITLRADYYDQPLKHPAFSTLMEKRTQVVRPLTTNELEQAIYEPANKMGVILESGLTSTIVGEVHEEPGALPILQYALTEIFERREGRLLTFEAYEAIGGVRGALARRAEEIYSGLEDVGKESARQLLLRLITLGEGEEDTRRRVLLSEIKTITGDILGKVIDAFGRARLLTFDHDPLTREPTIEVAHEALLKEWIRLREWLDESRADIRMQRVLGNAADEWLSMQRDPGFLLRGSRLDQFEAWAENTDLALSQLEVDYIEASLSERREREAIESERRAHEVKLERRSRNFLLALVGVMAVAAVAAAILSGVAFNQREIAISSAATATYSQGQAQNDAGTAVAAQEEAQQLAEAEAAARQEADKARRFSRANELVAFAQAEMVNPKDVSFSLALLLAKEAVMTSLREDEPVTPGAEDVLRQAIASAPVQQANFIGHSGSVNHAAWSPDGLFVATVGADGTARIWDVQSGEELVVFTGHTGAINYIAWSPDGEQVMTASDDRSVRIWEVATGEEVKVFEGHELNVGSAAWSGDGSQILSASVDAIILWETKSGEIIFESELFGQGFAAGLLQYAQFSPQGDHIASNYGNTLLILDAQTGIEFTRLGTQAGVSNSADWSSDGQRLLTAHDLESAIVWDMNTLGVIREFEHNSRVEQAAWSPDENLIATVTENGVVRIWDVQTGRLLNKWQANISPLWSVEWSPDGERILTAGADGVARIWQISTPGQGKIIELPSFLSTSSWSLNGEFILGTSTHTAYIWEVEGGKEIQRFVDHFSQIFSAAWNPDGARVISGDANGTAIIWDVESGDIYHKILGHSQAIFTSAWSPDGKLAITGGRDGTARIWDAESGEEIFQLQGHSGDVLSTSWSPGGDLIVTTGSDKKVIIWQANSGEEILNFEGHTGSVNDADWSPDGHQLVTVSNDRTVRIWDVDTGQEIDQFTGHGGTILTVDWKPGGAAIVTAGEDRTVRIWDANTGEILGLFSGHDGGIVEVNWNPDGSQILSASIDRTIRIWPVGIEGLLNQADSLILRDPPEFTLGERCIYLHDCSE